jgi:hypothetical protein
VNATVVVRAELWSSSQPYVQNDDVANDQSGTTRDWVDDPDVGWDEVMSRFERMTPAVVRTSRPEPSELRVASPPSSIGGTVLQRDERFFPRRRSASLTCS